MKSFWLFRTNLRQLEYYHDYTNLEEFKKNCHDFYLLQGIWFLENDIFDEVVIWRLAPKRLLNMADIVFTVNGKKFIQRFVDDFKECFSYSEPKVTFFRGGFPEYGRLTGTYPSHFGLKLYCGTGRRIEPNHGGIYDKILVEDDRDLRNGHIPFYKTANQEIFKPLGLAGIYDICWPCNFSQLEYKGQEYFINEVSKSDYLKSLKILHVGNMPEVGKELCEQYGVNNIEFAGHVSRPILNRFLNQSKVGLVTSNMQDGSPRVITEIIASGTPLVVRDKTRILDWYPHHTHGQRTLLVDSNIECTCLSTIYHNEEIRKQVVYSHEQKTPYEGVLPHSKITMDTICKKNLAQWGLA